MKRQVPIPLKKEMMPQMRGLSPHAAVHNAREHEMSANIPVKTQFEHDFSRVSVQLPTPGFGCDNSSVGRPLLPQLYPFGDACHTSPPRVQAKLKIGQPGDKYEQEADRVADEVMAPSANSVTSGKPIYIQSYAEHDTKCTDTVSIRANNVITGYGRPLEPAMREDLEHRFGYDFSKVRVHLGVEADQSSRKVNAQAYTVGRDIVFGAGQYAPSTMEGRKLIAHELTHVIQQEKGSPKNVIQRRPGCSTTQDTTITNDHTRARSMLSSAISAVSSYNGTTPAKVFNALSTHFHGATSNAFATWINVNLRYLWATTWLAGYECYTGGLFERTWACGPNALATTFWCVPNIDIRLCPSYFGQSPRERSTTLIHEWVHKYGCNFDLGYEHEPDYPGNWTVTQLLNADSFSSFIRDVS